jgi:Mn-containing catalase
MILRIDRLQLEIPMAVNPDPKAASTVQELMGGRWGEMSTFMNYSFQSWNMRGKDKIKPYYDLVSNISAEEYGHIEAVAATINSLLTGATTRIDDTKESLDSPLAAVSGVGLPQHFLNTGQGAVCASASGQAWAGDYILNSGDLVCDMLHNFFLETAARMGKLRVYEMADNPVARNLAGYLMVRGGVHQTAYAMAIQSITGCEVTKMLNIPNISTSRMPEAKRFMDQGSHRTLYRFSQEDYRDIDKIWRGTHWEDGGELRVQDGPPPESAPVLPLPPEPQVYAPGYHPGELQQIAERLMARV